VVNIRTTIALRQGAAGQEQSLARLLEQGRVLAVISGEALEDMTVGGHERIVTGYAEHVGYPLPGRDHLHTMVKYQSLTTGWPDRQLKQDYLDVIASHIHELAGQQGVNDDPRAETLADATDPDDLLLFYYSGRGDEASGESYLVRRDGRRPVLTDPQSRYRASSRSWTPRPRVPKSSIWMPATPVPISARRGRSR